MFILFTTDLSEKVTMVNVLLCPSHLPLSFFPPCRRKTQLSLTHSLVVLLKGLKHFKERKRKEKDN